MSALLLDTHIWLWYAEGNASRLPAASIRKIDEARANAGLMVSAISVWEVGILHGRGKVQLSAPLRKWVSSALGPSGISLMPLDEEIAAESTLLPGEPHGDPADRFLIAAARVKDAVVGTRDREILDYGRAGHVRALEL